VKVLAIETATAVCATSIVEGEKVLAELSCEEERGHAERLVGFIETISRESGVPLRDVDGIAVSIGPGSFTGLRIGLSVAKGLALALGKPLTAVSTLEALARNCGNIGGEDDVVVPLLDARRDELFAAMYRREGDLLACVLAPMAARLDELRNLLAAEQKIIFTGNGTEKYLRYLLSSGDTTKHTIPPHERSICSAVSVGYCGAEQFAAGNIADLASLEPVYCKEFYTTMNPLPTEKS
jgi:tRNA threonylcarbamoyladenosine biosynthesis protein TsaB